MSDAVSDILQETSPQTGAIKERLVQTKHLRNDPRNALVPVATDLGTRRQSLRHAIEAVVVAREGGVLLIGWADDAECPIDSIMIKTPCWRMTFDAATLARIRRVDVEQALGSAAVYPFGFFGVVAAPGLHDLPEAAELEVRLKDGGTVHTSLACRLVTAEGLRDLALGYLATAGFLGNQQAEAGTALDAGLGGQLITLNKSITGRITSGRHIERFVTHRRQPSTSIVVCLFGKPEFLFVQSALYAGRPGIEAYEFIYVCNSPEMTDSLLEEARAAHMIYGLNMTLVLLPGNAGFSAANNAGATVAMGRRILNINPDVFPRQADWAARHTALVETRPAAETRLFGTTLYYDDGSLMHGGMYFELDSALGVHSGRVIPRRIARVEHYGKGAPSRAATFVQPRPVPAVTGAFVSSDRGWYESLGGFDEEYIFGHYEDADLCLKSLASGTPAWMHDLQLWHLEGKGSTRKVHHEGGSIVNRWLFTRRWSAAISAGVLGPAPTHKLLRRAALSEIETVAAPPNAIAPAAAKRHPQTVAKAKRP